MLKCGFYEKEITPPLGGGMPGYFTKRIADDVRDRLYVKALSLAIEEKTAIIIVLDALYSNQTIYDTVVERVEKYTGISRDNILISGTHTHMGPALPGVINEKVQEDKAYSDVLMRLIADTAFLAWKNMKPATVKYASSDVEGLAFNRNYIMKDGSIRTNPGWKNPDVVKPFGPDDPEFTTLFFFDENENPIGSIINFACHHDSIGQAWGNKYSADYSGVVAHEMKKKFGMDFVTMYLTGACGNINHLDIYRENAAYEHPRYLDIGNALAEAMMKHYENAQPLNVDCIDAEKDIIPIEKRYYSQETIDEAEELFRTMPFDLTNLDMSHPEQPVYKRIKAEDLINISKVPNPVPVCVQTIRLGECMIFALFGEVYTEFGLELKEKSPAKVNLIATCANGGRPCYVPIAEAHDTAIYEAQLSSAYLEPNAGNKMVAKALEQAEKLK